MKRKPLIIYGHKDRSINTEYGTIKYEEWCKLEANRIGGGAYLVYNDGLVGVMDKKKKGER